MRQAIEQLPGALPAFSACPRYLPVLINAGHPLPLTLRCSRATRCRPAARCAGPGVPPRHSSAAAAECSSRAAGCAAAARGGDSAAATPCGGSQHHLWLGVEHAPGCLPHRGEWWCVFADSGGRHADCLRANSPHAPASHPLTVCCAARRACPTATPRTMTASWWTST